MCIIQPFLAQKKLNLQSPVLSTRSMLACNHHKVILKVQIYVLHDLEGYCL